MLASLRSAFLAVDRVTTAAVTFAACIALAGAAGLACYQIFMRYVIRQSTAWSEPALQLLIIYMVYLGAAATFRAGALVAIDFLRNALSSRARRGLDAAILIASLILLGHMVWYGWDMTMRAQFNVNPTLGISMSWGFAAIPIGGIFAIIAVIAHFLDPPEREIERGG